MVASSDMRIPVVMRVEPVAGDAVLVEDGHDMPADGYAVRFALGVGKAGHEVGCVCCTLRGPAADALTTMFRARAMGGAPFFGRVVVLASPEGEAAVGEALEGDVVTKARFRVGDI
jgi:G3E family GTPase